MRAVTPILPVEADVTISTSISPLPASMLNDAFSHGLTYPTGTECVLANGWPMCNEDDSLFKDTVTFPDDVGFRSFMAYLAIENCDEGYMSDESEESKAIYARFAFDAVKHQQLAKQLWFGSILPASINAQTGALMNPNLRDVATVPAGYDTAADPVMRIGRLVADRQRQAGSGRVLIHGPLELVPALTLGGIIKLVGGRYVGNGFIYVTDGGYPADVNDDDAGPIQSGSVADADQAYYTDVAGTAWLYATGAIEYAWGRYISKAQLGLPTDNDGRYSEFTLWNNRENQTVIQVEQEAFLRFDPCDVFAARVYIPSATQGQIA